MGGGPVALGGSVAEIEESIGVAVDVITDEPASPLQQRTHTRRSSRSMDRDG